MDDSRSVYGRNGSQPHDECPMPLSPEILANTLAELADARGFDMVSLSLRTRGVSITLEEYDNWDGGIWTWLIVEVDGDRWHQELPAEAQERLRHLEDEGVRIIRVSAKDCNSTDSAKETAKNILSRIERILESR